MVVLGRSAQYANTPTKNNENSVLNITSGIIQTLTNQCVILSINSVVKGSLLNLILGLIPDEVVDAQTETVV